MLKIPCAKNPAKD